MIEKKHIGYYQGYDIYEIIDAINNRCYMATSAYLSEGFVTRSSDTIEGLKYEINKTIQRIKLLRISRAAKHL